jgi:hypothetical protein
MAYKVKIDTIGSDGTNYYFEASISDGMTTFPPIRPSFSVEAAASEIDTYFQAVADAAPTLTSAIRALVGKTYTQA